MNPPEDPNLKKKPVQPRHAAAAIVMTDEPTPRVLMIKRSDKMRFMAGHHAFPGGRVDDDEGTRHVLGAENLTGVSTLTGGGTTAPLPGEPDDAVALHALVREVFEETGVLLTEGAKAIPKDAMRDARRAILVDETKFDDFLEAHGHTINAGLFHHAGTWVTPPNVPIRFNTRYFLITVPGEPETELLPENEDEISDIDWMTPTMARGLWRRGDILLPAPVAWVLQQLESFAMPEVLAPLRKTSHLPGDRPGRIEYRAGINSIPVKAPALPPADMTNCVVVGERELYVIDPGTTEHGEQALLVEQLEELLGHGEQVKAILLTHSHIDHVASAEFLRAKYGAPIWAHAKTAEHLKFKVDRLLEDGEIIPVAGSPDWRIKCLHTPGHDPGHLCFLEETTGTMLCGDMIANGSTIIVSLTHGGDMDDYLKSLERMLDEEFDMMIPGHGMIFYEEPKRIIRYYIEHRLKREAKVKAALEAAKAEGHVTVHALLKRAYDDTPEKLWPLAEHSLRAHLKRLGVELPDEPAADISGGL